MKNRGGTFFFFPSFGEARDVSSGGPNQVCSDQWFTVNSAPAQASNAEVEAFTSPLSSLPLLHSWAHLNAHTFIWKGRVAGSLSLHHLLGVCHGHIT